MTEVKSNLSILEMAKNKKIGQYTVSEWNIVNEIPRFNPNKNMVTVSMKLERSISNILLVTYLPTFLMNIINQFSVFITGESRYEIIITVNITSMMVLASIYLTVSSSLPSTSAIKPVEIWLLCNLAYPFLVIISTIILQAYIEIFVIELITH